MQSGVPDIYSQWERQHGHNKESGRQTAFTTLTRPTTTTSSPDPRTSRAEGRISKYAPLKLDPAEEKAERIRLLEMKVMTRRQTLASQKKRENELVAANMTMHETIKKSEDPAHEDVKKLLRKYEKFRGGMSFLSENFLKTLKEERRLLYEIEVKQETELMELKRQANELDKHLQHKLDQVHVLTNYKDKEYPVKAIRIAELSKEMDRVEMTNEEEFGDLDFVVTLELEKMEESERNCHEKIKEEAMESVLDKMHPTLKEMAKQNQVMESEIRYHEKESVHLCKDIESLRVEVKHLLEHPKTNLRKQVFPEFFMTQTKCTPDMDVILDIPTNEPSLI